MNRFKNAMRILKGYRILVYILLLVGSFVFVDRKRGVLIIAKVDSRLAEAGFPTSREEIIRAVPEGLNLAYSPLLSELFMDYTSFRQKYEIGLESRVLASVRLNNWMSGETSEFDELEESITVIDRSNQIENKYFKSYYSSEANRILAIMENYDLILNEVESSLSSYPDWQLPLQGKSVSKIYLPHIHLFENCSYYFLVKSLAYIDLGDVPNALKQLELSHRLSEILFVEPFFISNLVGLKIREREVQIIYHGLVNNMWNPDQVSFFLNSFLSTDWPKLYLKIIGEEHVWNREKFRELITGESNFLELSEFSSLCCGSVGWIGPRGIPGYLNLLSSKKEGRDWLFRTNPNLIYHNEATLTKSLMEHVIYMVDRETGFINQKVIDRWENEYMGFTTNPRKMVASHIYAFHSETAKSIVNYSGKFNLAKIGLVSHLFQMKNNRLPMSLEELQEFYPGLIIGDPHSCKPYKFIPQEPGIIVYGFGRDRKDHGGTTYLKYERLQDEYERSYMDSSHDGESSMNLKRPDGYDVVWFVHDITRK